MVRDDHVVCVLDRYPKAAHHPPFIARDPGLESYLNLRG